MIGRLTLSKNVLHLLLLVYLVNPLVSSFAPSSRSRFKQTRTPSLEGQRGDTPHLPHLTVLLPAYNEALRIESTLTDYVSYLNQSERWSQSSGIVVVNDGSTDATAEVVAQFAASAATASSAVTIQCLSMPHNGGKGAALAYGMQAIICGPDWDGGLILTADADGSADLPDLESLYDKMVELLLRGDDDDDDDDNVLDWTRPGLVCGTRTYASAAPGRLVFRWGFRTAVRLVCGDLGVPDSQCGFKLMTHAAALLLYQDLYMTGWSHDVEVLMRARRLGVLVREAAVKWEDKEGSKIAASPGGILAVSARMLVDVIRLQWSYATGVWKLPEYNATTVATAAMEEK